MNILIIEASLSLNDSFLLDWANSQPDSTVECIFNVYNADKKELIEKFNWCDILAFTTTFEHGDKIYTLGQLLASIDKPIDVYIDNPDAKKEVLKIVSGQLAFNLRHHTLYEFNPISRKKNIIGIQHKATYYKKKAKKEENKRKFEEEYKQSREKALTGRKIKINEILAFSPAYDTLKPDMIVDEIDNSEVDNEPCRGVWVWGNGEPVKLLKEGRINEYDFVDFKIDSRNLPVEICRIVALKPLPNFVYLITGILADDSLSMEGKSNKICELLNVEKRYNRVNIQKLLKNESIESCNIEI